MIPRNEKIHIKPPEPNYEVNPPFGDGTDIFDLKPFADQFARLINNIDLPSTIVLDGDWGSGKTTFIKQWCRLVETAPHHARTIYFDAFSHDYRQDPFVALTTAILAAANHDKSSRVEAFKEMAIKVGKFVAPALAGAAVNFATGGILSSLPSRTLAENTSATTAELAEKWLAERLDKATSEAKLLEDFRKSLSRLALQSNAGTENHPLVLVVDELDRCKPSFALDCIELIKHLFSVPGVCFVLVTKLDHLAAILKGRHGGEFDAATYLHKFYDLSVRLPDIAPNPNQKRLARYGAYLWDKMNLHPNGIGPRQYVKDYVVNLCRVQNLSLRHLERIASQYALYLATSDARNTIHGAPILAGLCAMRVAALPLFSKALTEEISLKEAEEFSRPEMWDIEDFDYGHYHRAWQYCLQTGDLSEDLRQEFTLMVRPTSRKSYIRWVAEALLNFQVPEEV